jgi:dihydrofolate reductase
MSDLVITNNITLDGVMESPERWAPPYADHVMAEYMARDAEREGTLLFGRRTYEQFASYWPHQPDDVPYAAILNNRMKYVVSTTVREPLPWANSTLLDGLDAVVGSGRRLFPEGTPFAKLRLVDSVTTTTGVVIGTFRTDS